jgi:hypothetical protein
MGRYILAVAALALCGSVVLMLIGADIAPAAGPMWRAGPFTSPFEAIQWKDQTPQVKVDGAWYDLLAINEFSTDQLIDFCRQLDAKDWQRRFDEDLPEVMARSSHSLGDTVTLKVKTDTGETKTLQNVKLTEENRRAIMAVKLAAAPAAGAGPWNGYPRLSPFTAVRWREQTPEVQVKGDQKWYELIAIDDIPANDIVAASRALGPTMTEKHFEEDLIELLTGMGHKPGTTADLKLKDLSSGQEQVMKDVPMTLENRQALWKARMDREKQ